VKGINIHPRNMTMFKGIEVVRDGKGSVAANARGLQSPGFEKETTVAEPKS
jgi:hypothetical protein